MVSLFENSENNHGLKNKKPMALSHQEFLKRIKKSLYLGPSNPNKMISQPAAEYCSKIFTDIHRNYSLKSLSMQNISKLRQQTPASLILSLIYLDRLRKSDPVFVKLVTPSELFLVTLMVSTKFYNDYDECDVFASTWAKEGEIDVERLKQLEIMFLNSINWNIVVSKNEFYEKLKIVEKILAMKEGLSRGWLTYTEMEQLMPSTEIIKILFNYTRIIVFSYVCSIAAIALSGALLTCMLRGNNQSLDADASSPLNLTLNSTTSTEILECKQNNNTLDFPFNTDDVVNWEIGRNYQQITSFYISPTKTFDSVPMRMLMRPQCCDV